MSASDKERIERLKRYSEGLEKQLEITKEKLKEEIVAKKNFFEGGFYLMSREGEKHLRALQKENKLASQIFSVFRENMQLGTNSLVISNKALARILDVSERSIGRAIKILKDHKYVQVVKIGTTNSYTVNSSICFAGNPGQRKACYQATVIAHECDQDEGWDDVEKIKQMPIFDSKVERPILNNEDLPPPDQQDLDLN